MVCVIPAAGKGTRMSSVTEGRPKELLPLGRKSVLERIMAEARLADPDEIVVVTSHDKPSVVDAVVALGSTTFADVPVRVCFQEQLNGVLGAVAAADVDDDLVILLGDCVFSHSPVERMAGLIHRGIDGCVAVESVTEKDLHLYGIVEVNDATGAIKGILEKPNPADTTSRWAVAARYALTKSIAAEIEGYSFAPGQREIGMTDFLNAMIAKGADLRAIALQPDQKRHDCGSPEDYAEARRERWD